MIFTTLIHTYIHTYIHRHHIQNITDYINVDLLLTINSNVDLLIQKNALLWASVAVGWPALKKDPGRVTTEEAVWLESNSVMTVPAKNTNQSQCKQSGDLVPGCIYVTHMI